jgi:hypothetical protein
VTVIVVPQSRSPRPWPSYQLRREVQDFLAARAPATVSARRIAVIGPTYLPIGATATVIPRDARQAGVVERRLRSALESFFHPLTGGPRGWGWPFGRDVYLSDLAAVMEAVEGVDFVRVLELSLRGVPMGDRVVVPADRIVVAGPIKIEMQTTPC